MPGATNTSNSRSSKARDEGTTTGRYPSRRRLDNGWSWHDCHQHWHYDNYAHYALRDLCTDDTVAWEDRAVVGHKNGWCVSDTDTYTDKKKWKKNGGRCGKPTPKPEKGLFAFTCENMGISSGCSDEYSNFFDCQWIDITGTPERAVPDGYYWLTVATNWDEAGREETSPENDYTNNEANVAIEIAGDTVRVLTSAQVHEQCPIDSAGARVADHLAAVGEEPWGE